MKCCVETCQKTLPGLWQPVILFWSEGAEPMSHQPASVQMNDFLVCEECKKTVTPLHLIDEKAWKVIKDAFKSVKKNPPSMKTAQIVYVQPDTLDCMRGEKIA